MFPRRLVCMIAPALPLLAAGPVRADYNVFAHAGGYVTDVIVNGQPEPLGSLRAFELRCGTAAAAGNWWMDEAGNLGLMGHAASYNVRTCQALGGGRRSNGGSCTFYGDSGYTCRLPR